MEEVGGFLIVYESIREKISGVVSSEQWWLLISLQVGQLYNSLLSSPVCSHNKNKHLQVNIRHQTSDIRHKTDNGMTELQQ